MVLTSPYGATYVETLLAVQARIFLLRDKDPSPDLGISRDIPGIPGIRGVDPRSSASVCKATESGVSSEYINL